MQECNFMPFDDEDATQGNEQDETQVDYYNDICGESFNHEGLVVCFTLTVYQMPY